MSTSHDPQFGHPNAPSGTRGPATIVWRDTAPGAAAAWAGPEAFSGPQHNEPLPDERPVQSLSSAWASAAPAPAQRETTHQVEEADEPSFTDAREQQQDSEPSAVGADEHDVVDERPGGVAAHQDDQRSADPGYTTSSDDSGNVSESDRPQHDRSSDWGAASAGALGGAAAAGAATPGGWVQPGSAPTADEVHHNWTEQHGELPPSSEPWSAPDDQQAPQGGDEPAQHAPDPYASPAPDGQGEYRDAGRQTHDPYARPQADQAESHDPYAQPQGDQAQSHDPYVQPQAYQAQGHDPYAGAPYQQPQQHDPYNSPADHVGQQHDSSASSFLAKPQSQAPAQQDSSLQDEQPWGGHSGQEQHHQPQDAAAAEDAWSAHQHSEPDQPMATDPSAGDAIPAPPTGQENVTVSSSNSGAENDAAADDESLTIGRGRDNSIVLDDMLVSRKHLRITADDQGLLLEDLGSRNGTYVNGRRVETSHLQEGDRIGVGGTTFEVRDGWLVTI
ncbi:FHA domain-containing protein [Yimella sp. cx-51]|uniref:FHA domain-containing protein n=1 Tax=Yimella sp. cx-51 TaxID=2770551 RepID=UPI00165E45B0|nr:FHA domain-containing protein [Yimella sp. cx-51]MBC9956113.1 FHA domain-containing protein [Yimella sp. cx-51]MBD2758279.1 FHA domain-containing protein [Yimella sp. cx-573]QTH37357.1 FHA domain-containing protein [Yimella sp. cx-51]